MKMNLPNKLTMLRIFMIPVFMVFLCVMVFILSGFEHCIANMYYFSVAGA